MKKDEYELLTDQIAYDEDLNVYEVWRSLQSNTQYRCIARRISIRERENGKEVSNFHGMFPDRKYTIELKEEIQQNHEKYRQLDQRVWRM